VVDGFRETLRSIAGLSWSSVGLGLSLLILDPSANAVSVLGVDILRSRILTVVPLVLVGLGGLRQIFIRNAIFIVQRTQDRGPLLDIVLGYPLVESMRWKLPTSFESFVLTWIQVLIDLLPAVSLIILWGSSSIDGVDMPPAYRVAVFALVGLGLWNYHSLRAGVHEPLAGPIRTPD
jgi:hypothetical protein